MSQSDCSNQPLRLNVEELITQDEEERLAFMALSEADLEWKREVRQEAIAQGTEQGFQVE